MPAESPNKDDALAHREKSDAIKTSPVIRAGTPRGATPRGTPRSTPRVGTPRTGTPRATPRVSTPKTDTPAKREPIAADVPADVSSDVPADVPAEHDEVKSPEKNGEMVNGDATEKVNLGFKEDVAIDEFVSHRVDHENSTVDIQVRWEGGETTWETEWSLQEQVPTLVYKYWEKLGGREESTQLDIFHVFRILKRTTLPGKSKGVRYQVQWVGYRQSESTLEQESKLRMIAPGELEKFEAKQLASGATEKRKSTRGPGRPRKKPRVED
ncbi:hypothetical protein F53441_12326 [Fusarium austroafricanum]|uniref:Chromo domain-containing protein n=1 Tax=Fusarium austroafricanum TaxID=2364996 RepID=A0A8H4K0G0_9HYPO|nr:hypothetical protein F53441_12326 [Fusarium austroafricanum]